MMSINLLDLNNDILNIIGDYVKKDNLLKQDIFDYVDIHMKIKRKEARNEKDYLSRDDKRTFIWVYCVDFYHNRFGKDILNDHYIFGEMKTIFNEYLKLKNSI